MKRARLFFAALALAAPAIVRGQVAPPPSAPTAPAPPDAPLDPTLEQELVDIDARAAKVTDLTASFEQTKRSPLLKDPLISRGIVKVKGTRVLWLTTSPRPVTMLVDAAQVRIFYPEQRVVEVYELDDTLRRLVSSPLARLESVKQQFSISRARAAGADEGSTITIRLTPIAEDLRARVTEIEVTLERTTGLATRIDLTDSEGEKTTISFSNARTDATLRDDELTLDVPEGTRISRPLEGLRAAPAPRQPGRDPK